MISRCSCGRDVLERLGVVPARIVGRHADDLVVLALLVAASRTGRSASPGSRSPGTSAPRRRPSRRAGRRRGRGGPSGSRSRSGRPSTRRGSGRAPAWPMPSSNSYLLRLPFGISTKASSSWVTGCSSVSVGPARAQGYRRRRLSSPRAMRWLAAPLAAALAALGLAACGDGGAEPGASDEATLVLDFQPNAVHAGIYRGARRRRLRRRRDRARRPRAVRVDRRAEAARLRQGASSRSSTSTTSALARERGLDVVGVARDRRPPARGGDRPRSRRGARPADLEGGTVGRHRPALRRRRARLGARGRRRRPRRGRPGDDRLRRRRRRSRPASSTPRPRSGTPRGSRCAGLGVPTREFRVDDFGAPAYPELVLDDVRRDAARRTAARRRAWSPPPNDGYDDVGADPQAGLDDPARRRARPRSRPSSAPSSLR